MTATATNTPASYKLRPKSASLANVVAAIRQSRKAPQATISAEQRRHARRLISSIGRTDLSVTLTAIDSVADMLPQLVAAGYGASVNKRVRRGLSRLVKRSGEFNKPKSAQAFALTCAGCLNIIDDTSTHK